MTTWVIMTAMPPTLGHQALIDFAEQYGNYVNVLICTQPHEPFVFERVQAITMHYITNPFIQVLHYSEAIEQNPEATGFWDTWRNILREYGFQPGDRVIASEPYGQQIADLMDGKFVPFDMYREINKIKATEVRKDLLGHWDDLMPEFQDRMAMRITIFGAESTGKTTLANNLAERLDATYVPEYARPYLETVGNEITVASMTDIANGQLAMQRIANKTRHRPYIIQDTDLYSTVGYWNFPHWRDELGTAPWWLQQSAAGWQSDLYLVTLSNIPFEEDPLRYGGDHREGSDEYWINLLKTCNLPYVVIDSSEKDYRVDHANVVINHHWFKKVEALKNYDRGGF